MQEAEHVVYSAEVLELVSVARKYTEYIESIDDTSLKDYIDQAHKILPELYFRTTSLPELSPDFEELNQRFVTEEDYNQLHQKLLKKFGEYDAYEEVFDRNRMEADEAVGESISENLCDIYQDAKDFVLLYEVGTNEVMYEAVWEFKQSFEQFWGQTLTNTLRALHHLRYGEKEIEENNSIPNENSNFNDVDTNKWFISRRQEDLRDDE